MTTFFSYRMEALRNEERHHKAPPGPCNQIGGLVELIAFARPRSIVEIGSHRGVSTEVFLLHGIDVTVVDPWPQDEYYREFLGRCSAYKNLRIVRGKSPDEMTRFAECEFDMCYIDGEHWDKDVRADIAACVPVVSKWIAGHDFNHATVAKAVRDLLGEPEHVFSDSSWIIAR